MAQQSPKKRVDILASTVRVPEHVVHRSFAHETVVLNLKTGRYHGLNPTAGTMLSELERGGTVGDVAARLAASKGWPREQIQSDLSDLCLDLIERDLLELVGLDDESVEGDGPARAG